MLNTLYRPAPKELVLKLLEKYAEGGSFNVHRSELNISGKGFYAALAQWPELEILYRDIQKLRADGMLHEVYDIALDSAADPKRARVQSDIRMKIAGLYDRARYGERLALDVQHTVDLTGALADARGRLRLRRDLENVEDAQLIESPRLMDERATDKLSVSTVVIPKLDIFED